MSSSRRSIHVLHDGDWQRPGGGARVAVELASALDAPLTVGHTGAPEWWDDQPIETSIAFPGLTSGSAGAVYRHARSAAELRLGQAFRSLDLASDIVITSGTAAKWYVASHDQSHIHYCHTPPPRCYADPPSGWIRGPLATISSVFDRHFATFPDGLLANSTFTKQRIRNFYDRKAEILHPPIRTARFQYQPPNRERYIVMIGRINDMKRARMVAETFRSIDDASLVLVGDGPERAACERIDGVTVYPDLSDRAVEELVARSLGGIAFGENEHCGLTPKEFQAAGKPVLVPDEPNLCNHVVGGETGIIAEPSHAGVRRGVRELLKTDWDHDRIQQAAAGWSTEQFWERTRDIVGRLVTEADQPRDLEPKTEESYA